MNAERSRGDELVDYLLGSGANDGKAANDLLKECFRGYPVEKLIPLLRSNDSEVVKAGAFIVGELAAKARPLMPEIMRLLGHRERWVKCDMLEAVLLAATAQEGAVIARAVELVNDPDREVATKAFEFLASAEHDHLTAAVPDITDPGLAANLSWMLRSEGAADVGEIESRIEGQDALTRWIGTVAASREYFRNPKPLNRAAESRDEELRSFAADQRKWHEQERLRQQRRRERARRQAAES